MSTRARERFGILLATLGVLIWLASIALHWGWPERYRWELAPNVVGAIMAFIGLYMIRPRETKDGADALVDYGVRILAVVRTGKRATDPVVTVTKREEVPQPTPPAAPSPVVTEEHDG